jgi:hypothetical protein
LRFIKSTSCFISVCLLKNPKIRTKSIHHTSLMCMSLPKAMRAFAITWRLSSVVCRPLAFHILIFSSATPQPYELKLARKHLWVGEKRNNWLQMCISAYWISCPCMQGRLLYCIYIFNIIASNIYSLRLCN